MTTDDRTPLMRELDALDVWDPQEPRPGFADAVLEGTPTSPPAPRRGVATRVAFATIAAAILVGLLGWWITRDTPVRDGSLIATTRQSVALTERTVIVAEPGAELSWTQRAGVLVVEQHRGNAFYRVDSDTSAFSVHTPAGQVQVTGTCFSVELKETPSPVDPSNLNNRKPLMLGAALAVAATVTVYEGRTVLANEAGTVQLEAGERGIARTGSAPSKATSASLALADDAAPDASAPARELLALRSENRRQATELEQLRQRLGATPSVQGTSDEAPVPAPQRNRFSGWGPPIPEGFDHYQPTQEALEEMAECGIVAWDQPPVWADDQQPDPEYLGALGLTEEERTGFEEAFNSFRGETIAQARDFYVELGGSPELAKAIDPSELIGMVYGKTDLDTREESRIALAMERAGLAEAPQGEPPPSERFLRWDSSLGDTFEAALSEQFGAKRAQELRAARGGWPGKRSTWADLCSERK